MIKLKQYNQIAPTVGLEQRAVALESFMVALESAQDSPELMELMGVSTEGFVGKLIDAAKEAIGDLAVSLRKWKAGDWTKLSEEDQTRLVKKAKLQFFYYNPKYLSNLENIYKLNLEAIDILVSTHDEAKLEAIAKKIAADVTKIINAAGGDSANKDLKQLHKEYSQTLAKYAPSESAKPDPTAIPKILEMAEKYKISTKNIDALRLVSKDLGLEASVRGVLAGTARVAAVVTLILGWVLLFHGAASAALILFMYSFIASLSAAVIES